jgi:hypothetical protein
MWQWLVPQKAIWAQSSLSVAPKRFSEPTDILGENILSSPQ